MNILHLSAVKNWGGGGQHILNLCYELSKTHKDVKNIVVVAQDGQFHERLKKGSQKFTTLPLAIKVDPRAILKLIKLCRKEKIDIIHIHGSNSLTLAVIANFFSDLPPFVFSKKTSFKIKDRFLTKYKYNHYKLKKILCVSEVTKNITAAAITDKHKLKTIYHGTCLDNKSTFTPFKIREYYRIPADNKIIGLVANHIKAKDLLTWVAVIDYLVNQKSISGLKFVQIGSPSAITNEIKAMLTSKKLSEHVQFIGYSKFAANFIKQFDVFLLTSKSEGLPQVICESFYHKIPVVSTNTGGIPELIEDGINGYLSEVGDYKSLGDNIVKLLNDTSLATRFTERSFEKLTPRFTSENMASETLVEYKKILR